MTFGLHWYVKVYLFTLLYSIDMLKYTENFVPDCLGRNSGFATLALQKPEPSYMSRTSFLANLTEWKFIQWRKLQVLLKSYSCIPIIKKNLCAYPAHYIPSYTVLLPQTGICEFLVSKKAIVTTHRTYLNKVQTPYSLNWILALVRYILVPVYRSLTECCQIIAPPTLT